MFIFCKSIQPSHLKETFQKKTMFAYKTSLFLQHFVFCFQYVPCSFYTDTDIVYCGVCDYACVCVVLRKAQSDRCQVQVCPPPWLAEQGRGAEQAGGREGIDRVRGKEGLAVSQTDLLIL